MVPKFANPHSLSQDVEITTRSDIAGRAGLVVVHQDEDSQNLKRNLDNMLRDIWAGAPTETSGPSKAKKRRKMMVETANKDEPALFRLVSNTSHPRYICLDPKPLPSYISRGPDCEDDDAQAETRRIRALSVAVDFESLAVSKWQVDPKPVAIETKVLLTNTPLARPLPPMLVTEENHTSKVVRRVVARNQQGSPAASPHESRPSCVVLPVMSVQQREVTGEKRKRRKFVRERPPPAYWRPSSDLRGKCMGYALGYPSNWAPEQAYVRDVMKMSCCAPQ